MVLRKTGWRIITLAVAVYAAASAVRVADARNPGFPMPPAPIPDTADTPVARDPQSGARLIWGGPVPPASIPDHYVPSPAYGDAPPAVAQPEPYAAEPGPSPPPMEPGPGDYGRTYPVQDARPRASAPPAEPEAELQTRLPAVEPELGGEPSEYGARSSSNFDPWEGLTEAEPAPIRTARPTPTRRVAPSLASLGRSEPPVAVMPAPRGALEEEAPSGYRPLPASEAMCRRELRKLGVRFTEASGISSSRSCGIEQPVRVTEAVEGIAMSPPAVLNCQTALRTARWLHKEVKPAARWKLWKRPTALINMSSYRCSRIAGSRTISEHASGNALDVGGFRFSDGSTVRVEPKGLFSFREKAFQTAIREGSCRHFGTVLGPGYNRAHADHLHLDAKTRLLPICK